MELENNEVIEQATEQVVEEVIANDGLPTWAKVAIGAGGLIVGCKAVKGGVKLVKKGIAKIKEKKEKVEVIDQTVDAEVADAEVAPEESEN